MTELGPPVPESYPLRIVIVMPRVRHESIAPPKTTWLRSQKQFLAGLVVCDVFPGYLVQIYNTKTTQSLMQGSLRITVPYKTGDASSSSSPLSGLKLLAEHCVNPVSQPCGVSQQQAQHVA
eukprot:TRINITY_DN108687_c0_g1_i1.p2 TRINITY_DN108687_c0_g1~~TRINITY_DN108687_c0_g1_i1.p2  ORF type:complete len:121 (+),score=17.55 TRINITY_DN108687_c0_g1_i1:569-931(+)